MESQFVYDSSMILNSAIFLESLGYGLLIYMLKLNYEFKTLKILHYCSQTSKAVMFLVLITFN